MALDMSYKIIKLGLDLELRLCLHLGHDLPVVIYLFTENYVAKTWINRIT